MTKATVRKFGLAILVGGTLVFGFASSSSTECEQACQQTFAQAQGACDTAYTQKLKELAEQQKQCNRYLPFNPRAYYDCTRQVDAARQQAFTDHERCTTTAQANAASCFAACGKSPSAP